MSVSEKIKRLKQALEETEDPDYAKTIKGVIVGMTNYNLGLSTEVARKRYEDFCKECDFNVQDPVPELRIQDKKIPELSERMCDHCGGCLLSYKLRQSIKPCEFWK